MAEQNIKSKVCNLCVDNIPHKDAQGVRQLPVGILYGLGMYKYQEIFLHNRLWGLVYNRCNKAGALMHAPLSLLR